jgi:CheY-like chemotaxis protein
MNILLVEDEIGIRDGLAALLRLRGHVVHVADSAALGAHMAKSGDYDLLVTDWRLGDGLGELVLREAACPALVMTGYPDEVAGQAGDAVILRKPVHAQTLLAEVERREAQRAPRADADASDGASAGDSDVRARLAALPSEARDRLTLAWLLAGADPHSAVRDDGACAVLETPLSAAGERKLPHIEALGGDARVLQNDDGLRLELRVFRDGRPEGTIAVPFDAPWPAAPAALAIDLQGAGDLAPDAFVELVQRAAAARRDGRAVHLLDIPPHLRLYLEILDLEHLLPKRHPSGPRLPEVLEELWGQELWR